MISAYLKKEMLVTDSLFSIEFVVEKLLIKPSIICRFPIIAFRLLDFPTVVIHLLERPTLKRLRAKLTIDPSYQVPQQIRDFQDESGYYPFNSGKSCLYKISPDVLRSQLSLVPLYIMVADEFSSTPSLVGSSPLPLDGVMTDIYESLIKDGLSVPACSGIRSSLRVYNLMGHDIGQLIVGCRLISLGTTLLCHLPDNAVTEPSHDAMIEGEQLAASVLTDIANQKTQKDFPLVYIDQPDILGSNTTPAHPRTVTLGSADLLTDTTNVGDQRIQVSTVKNVLEKKRTNGTEHIESTIKTDEWLIASDVICPPPLFYNKQAVRQPYRSYLPSDPDSATLNTTELSSAENLPLLLGSKTPSPEPSGELPATVSSAIPTRADPANLDVKSLNALLQASASEMNASQLANRLVPASLSSEGCPLLFALLSELLKLAQPNQTASANEGPSTKTHRTMKGDAAHGTPVRVTPVTPVRTRVAPSPPLQRSPSHLSNKQERSIAAASPPALSRQLSSASSGHTKGTPLTYGMTITQKLRLSRSNPALLQQIVEKEAEERRQKEMAAKEHTAKGSSGDSSMRRPSKASLKLKLKGLKGKHKGGLDSFRSFASRPSLELSTEMSRLQLELQRVKHELAESQRIPPVAEFAVTRVLTPTGRVISPKPSATPRRSLSARNSRDADLSTLLEQPTHSSTSLTQTGLSSRVSLEIHLPSQSLLPEPDLSTPEPTLQLDKSETALVSSSGQSQRSAQSGESQRSAQSGKSQPSSNISYNTASFESGTE